ncbi:MAG: DUF4215 domain-containing protein [Nannocystis sp.]|nr:DUF4215 domain-containing protein [Nannocystis sp.]
MPYPRSLFISLGWLLLTIACQQGGDVGTAEPAPETASTSSSSTGIDAPDIPTTGASSPVTTDSTSTTIGDASTSTGVCGDGVVEGDETCDDGNAMPGDGCQECERDSTVFITSEVYQGFALGGLYGADQRCQSLAAKAGLQHFLTFKAWLSTPSMSVADRFRHSRGRYVLVNGLVVAGLG